MIRRRSLERAFKKKWKPPGGQRHWQTKQNVKSDYIGERERRGKTDDGETVATTSYIYSRVRMPIVVCQYGTQAEI